MWVSVSPLDKYAAFKNEEEITALFTKVNVILVHAWEYPQEPEDQLTTETMVEQKTSEPNEISQETKKSPNARKAILVDRLMCWSGSKDILQLLDDGKQQMGERASPPSPFTFIVARS